MSDLSKIINEQRDRITELERCLVGVANGATGQAPCAKYCEARATEITMRNLKKRLAEVERELDKLRCAVATAIDVFDDYDMDVETYAPIKHVKMKQGLHDSLNEFAIKQKIEGAFEFAIFLNSSNFSATMAAKESGFFKLAETLATQLRQQLNGGDL